MTEWTSDATKARDAFLARWRRNYSGSDLNIDEVIEDLRHHIDEELKGIPIVTQEDVTKVIRHLDIDINQNEAEVLIQKKKPNKATAISLMMFAVVLPFISILAELTTHACAAAFFDPIPTWWHVIIIISIPILHVFTIVHLYKNPSPLSPIWLGFNGFCIIICFFYVICFAPLYIPASIAIFYFGLGLLPFGPLFGFIASLFLKKHLKRRLRFQTAAHRFAGIAGALIAILLLTILEFPSAITRIGLEWADDENPRIQHRGIVLLRKYGDAETMLRACYERPRKFTNFAALLISRDNLVYQQEAREIFFRAKGRAFNAFRPPRLYTRNGRWNVFDELTWDFDEGQAGTAVAGRVRGLFLESSRIDCRIHSQAAVAYLEWIFEFQNQSQRQSEARVQILMPANAVISRLTLWVNGEEREAAFAGRSEVREAYENIVKQRRDPVLVTTAGKDRILVQCFPVPPDGGRMKTRIGMSIPLSMMSETKGFFTFPRMIERNFNLKNDLEHALWIESRADLTSTLSSLRQAKKEDESKILFGQISDLQMMSPSAQVHVNRPENPPRVWTRGLGEDDLILQTLVKQSPIQPDRLVIVLDTSYGMAPFLDEISEAIATFHNSTELFILQANDSNDSNFETQLKPVSLLQAQARIQNSNIAGGQDNLKSLLRAWDLAAQSHRGIVLWIHGPQPVTLSSPALLQRIERGMNRPILYEVQTLFGPNRLLENKGMHSIKRIPRSASLKADLTKWFEDIKNENAQWKWIRKQHMKAEVAELNSLPEVTDHIRRLWASDQVEKLVQSNQLHAAKQLASEQQLVTSISGAVVLETKTQFENAGLTPVPHDSVPIIPEPNSYILFIVGLSFLYVKRHIIKHIKSIRF